MQIQGPGLKKPGIVILQTVFISLFVFIEMNFRTGVGVLSGVAICLALLGSLRFGRPGTTYLCVVTPPLAFAGSVLVSIVLLNGLKPSRVGIDFIAALASEAPFLIAAAVYGWFVFLNQKAKRKPPKRKAVVTKD
jgi:hypothetical protein